MEAMEPWIIFLVLLFGFATLKMIFHYSSVMLDSSNDRKKWEAYYATFSEGEKTLPDGRDVIVKIENKNKKDS